MPRSRWRPLRACARGIRCASLLAWLPLLLLLAPAAAAAPPRQQAVDPLEWQRYTVNLDVQVDGDLLVTETQTLLFNAPTAHAEREVAQQWATIADLSLGEPNLPYAPAARSEHGAQPFSYSTGQSDSTRGLFRVDWWFPPTAAAHRTFVLRYRVPQRMRSYTGGDLLTWNAIPADRDGAIRDALVTVTWPGDVPRAQVHAEVSVGGKSESAAAHDGRTLTWTAHNLAPGSGVDLQVRLPHASVVDRVDAPQEALPAAASWTDSGRVVLLILAGAIVLVVLLVGLWWLVSGGVLDVGSLVLVVAGCLLLVPILIALLLPQLLLVGLVPLAGAGICVAMLRGLRAGAPDQGRHR